MPARTPTLADLYRLAEQLELDREVPAQRARERDHAIGETCAGQDDVGRLSHWLDAVGGTRDGQQPEGDLQLTEGSMAVLGRLGALAFGFAAMATFLLASPRGLVNVFMFLLLFVIVQLLLCLVAAAVMARMAGGGSALVLPVNPARLLMARTFPDRRYLREAQSVLRLLLLRYGQELGALFTLGAIAAFFLVLALSDFTFVWGSTFRLSDTLVEDMTSVLASPWAGWLPAATVSSDLIFASRYHPAVTALSPANIEDMRGWWPFLIMSMVTYALLPRLLLWLFSRLSYAREIRNAFTRLPGSERVLARMQAPLVRTQGQDGGGSAMAARGANSVADPRLVLLNWANALSPEDLAVFEAFAAVPDGNIINAGLGSLPEELARLGASLGKPVAHICVALKSWEPPMADLADFLGHFTSVPRCTLYLVPLPNRPVSAGKLADWQAFARRLDFPVVDVQALERSQ